MIGDRVDDLSTVLCGINVNTEGTPAERHAYDLDNRVGNFSDVGIGGCGAGKSFLDVLAQMRAGPRFIFSKPCGVLRLAGVGKVIRSGRVGAWNNDRVSIPQRESSAE